MIYLLLYILIGSLFLFICRYTYLVEVPFIIALWPLLLILGIVIVIIFAFRSKKGNLNENR